MDSSESQAWTSLGHTLPSPFCVRGRRGAPLSTLSPPILCQRCPDIYTVQLSFLCKKLWTCAKRWHRWAASFQVERGKQWANFLTKSAVCQVVARAMEKTKARKRGEGVGGEWEMVSKVRKGQGRQWCSVKNYRRCYPCYPHFLPTFL